MSAAELVGTIDLPPEWLFGLARVVLVEPVATADIGDGKGLLAILMLSDASNLMALTYPGGQALLRVAPMSSTIESRFTGRKPSSDPLTEKMWGIAVDSLAGAIEKTNAELGL